jgi:1-aminocyclopropane-1-carboxylate deaminase
MVNLPETFASIPREHLLYDTPTPVHPLHRLSKDLSLGITVWMKREDTNSGLAFGGGNKIRKMEYVLPEVIAAGADTLVTEGGLQSNHCRQVTAIAARYGMKVRLILCRVRTWSVYKTSS